MSEPGPTEEQPSSPPLTESGDIPGYYKCAMFGMGMPILALVAGTLLKSQVETEEGRRKLVAIFAVFFLFGAWLSAKGLIGAMRAGNSKARLRGAVGLAANLVWLVLILGFSLTAPK